MHVVWWTIYGIVMLVMAVVIWRQTGRADAAQKELERRREAWDRQGHWP